jgi:zeta-carotene desaturase
VLFQLCTNLIGFYKTIGIEDRIRWFDRMTFIEPGGRQSVLRPSFLPAPLHVTPSFLGFKFLTLRDKIALIYALSALITGKPADSLVPFQVWLERHRQTPNTIERFWKPILISALSEDLDRIAVPYAAQVVRESMKSRSARIMGIPAVPLSDLYIAARDYISGHGGALRLRTSVQSFLPTEDHVAIRLADSEERFDYAVLAIPFDTLRKLLPESAEGEDLREKLGHFSTAPITGVHLWFDRRISELPHAVLLGRTIQWMFHKSLLLAPARCSRGLAEPVASAALGFRGARGGSFDQDGRPSGEGQSNDGGSYVELVISASKSLIEQSRHEIIDLALKELREFFPGARDASLVKATVVKELNATFSPMPGIDRYRPGQRTSWPRVFLAGDWTATGWPATMEGAVRSGYLAAEEVTTSAGDGKSFVLPDLGRGGLMRILA